MSKEELKKNRSLWQAEIVKVKGDMAKVRESIEKSQSELTRLKNVVHTCKEKIAAGEAFPC